MGRCYRKTNSYNLLTVLVGKDLTTVKVKDTHLKTVRQVSEETIRYVEQRRKGKDDKAIAKRHNLSKIPWPFRAWVF